jgi:LCP family protein required for cell wall assembly
MQTQRRKPVKQVRLTVPNWLWLLLSLLIGLVVGWLAIGWGAWPVSYKNATASSLRLAEREEYLAMVAESLSIDGDIASAQNKLQSWSQDRLAEDLTRLQARLWKEEGVPASQFQDLGRALGVEVGSAAGVTEQAAPADLSKTDNILVLGIDNWGELGRTWRTDTIMVLAIDRKTNQIGIVSIPRDLYVDLPGFGKERINAAHVVGEKRNYPGGGTALAQRVVEEAVGIPTQHYAILRREGLEKLVDALGGVTVTLDCPLYEARSDHTSPTGIRTLTLPAGKVFLDGPTAMEFVTFRYVESDFGRVRRQQQLIWAIRDRALQINVLPRIPELWQALSDAFTTDLSLPDVIRLATLGSRLKAENVHGLVLGRDVVEDYVTQDGGQVLVFKDKAAVQEKLSKLFSGAPLAETGKLSGESEECPPSPFEGEGQ